MRFGVTLQRGVTVIDRHQAVAMSVQGQMRRMRVIFADLEMPGGLAMIVRRIFVMAGRQRVMVILGMTLRHGVLQAMIPKTRQSRAGTRRAGDPETT